MDDNHRTEKKIELKTLQGLFKLQEFMVLYVTSSFEFIIIFENLKKEKSINFK